MSLVKDKIAFAIIFTIFAAMNASSAELQVVNTADSGPGSFRAAVAAANPNDSIVFAIPACPCQITLATGTININKPLTITGPGAAQLTIHGNSAHRVLTLTGLGNTISISDLTIAGGQSASDGAGISSDASLILTRVVISNNRTTGFSGGGILSAGNLTVRDSEIRNNRAGAIGGGIQIDGGGTNSIINTVFDGNIADSEGGGLYHSGGTLQISGGRFASNSAIRGGAIFASESMTVSGTDITGNSASNGAGVYSTSVSLNVVAATIDGNTATGNGGGICNFGASSVVRIDTQTVIATNDAMNGGGIWNSGTAILADSSVKANDAASGGGIYNLETVSMIGSVLEANAATSGGGGVYNEKSVTATNSTISGNSAPNGGGFLNAQNLGGNATINFLNATIAENSATTRGGGVRNLGILNSKNSIIALNTGPIGPDVDGGITSDGNNLIGNTSGSGGTIASDITNADPLLGPLADNGGMTETRALLALSPAIDAGSNAGAPLIDQRGISRPMNAAVDIGAFEVNICGSPFVTNTGNAGLGSLRCAIAASTNTDVINFNLPPGSVITLSEKIILNKPILVDGTGAGVTLSGGGTTNVFDITSSATIAGLTFVNGSSPSAGAINVIGEVTGQAGNALIDSCTFEGNSGTDGGALGNFGGTLTVTASTFSGNSSSVGGAIISRPGATVDASTTIVNSTISGNLAGGGGGVANVPTLHLDSVTTIINSTIAQNTATIDGGGLFGGFRIMNSIVAGNIGPNPDVSGLLTSFGYNLIQNPTGGNGFVATDILNVSPLLAPLANNGGSTKTHALLSGSPAIDKGSAANLSQFARIGGISNPKKRADLFGAAISTDQRGAPRPVDLAPANAPGGDGSDIGAYELTAPTAAEVSVAGHITTGRSEPFARAVVVLTDDEGMSRSVNVGSFGYFQFDGVVSGRTYVITVRSKTAVFDPLVIQVDDHVSGIELTAR